MQRILTIVGALCLISNSTSIMACTCAAWPLLSPASINSEIVSAHVIRHLENENGEIEAMELQVSRVFNGKVDETIVVQGGSGLSCTSEAASFPIGSEWVFPLYQAGNALSYQLASCFAEMEIVDAEIEGYIRDSSCAGNFLSPDCAHETESMSIDTFDALQEVYFSAARDALTACTENRIEQCPQSRAVYIADEQLLRLPYVGIFNSQSDLSEESAQPPIAELNMTLELLEGWNGRLIFDVYHISTIPPTP